MDPNNNSLIHCVWGILGGVVLSGSVIGETLDSEVNSGHPP